jgi:hypothetical protein
MSVLGLTKLSRELEHDEGLLARFRSDPILEMRGFDLTAQEVEWVLDLDAQSLLDHGVNPVVLRNLLVLLGVQHGQMYTHQQGLRSGDHPTLT